MLFTFIGYRPCAFLDYVVFAHFIANTCQLLITNGADVFKKNLCFCLTLGYVIQNLLCLFAELIRENPPPLKTNKVTKLFCSQVACADT